MFTYFSSTFALVDDLTGIDRNEHSACGGVIFDVITAKLVEPAHRAKALGLIFIGISSSLVLGVPIGIFYWQRAFTESDV
ncbi:hypothetical protein VQ056_29855 [Paenibacillus sp. JTLBN-2024]